MDELQRFLIGLDDRARFEDVGANSLEAQAFVRGHIDKAKTCLRAARRFVDNPLAVIPWVYQIALSTALAELRIRGVTVAPYQGDVDEEVIRGWCVAVGCTDSQRRGAQLVLELYSRTFDALPVPSIAEAAAALEFAASALRGLVTRQTLDEPALIHCSPETMGGRAVFVGTRLPVEFALDRYDSGEPWGSIVADHPSLTTAHIEAAREWVELFGRAARRHSIETPPGLRLVSRRVITPPSD